MNDAQPAYRLFRPGDLNAFFALMLDNLTQLVILAGVLMGVFGIPQDIVLNRMIPGSAIGVLVGDLLYTRMAVQLARRTGRRDVTAMPLGIDTVSLFAFSFGIVGPAYLATKDPNRALQIGTAAIVVVAVIKMVSAFLTPYLRRLVPRAGLLGPIAAVAILLIAFLPSLKLFHQPIVGFLSLTFILVCLIGRIRMFWNIPAAFAGIAIGTGAYYLLVLSGMIAEQKVQGMNAWLVAIPWPSFGFLQGLPLLSPYLALVFPFALVSVIGGTDVTESAAAGGDDYSTRNIILIDGLATLIGGLCGGVVQTTPYIGHPAYKDMGGGAGYTLATGLFIGLAGMLGVLSYVVNFIPEAAVAPILIFIGVEIMAQTFNVTPAAHHRAVAMAFVPVIAYLVLIQVGSALTGAGSTAGLLTGDSAVTYHTLVILGNGFIITSLLWGAAVSKIIDQRLEAAAGFLAVAAVGAFFGVIHSPFPDGRLFWPWRVDSKDPIFLFAAYLLMAGILFLWGRVGKKDRAAEISTSQRE
jgi:adenine/guanine/hypoxanthine permease